MTGVTYNDCVFYYKNNFSVDSKVYALFTVGNISTFKKTLL